MSFIVMINENKMYNFKIMHKCNYIRKQGDIKMIEFRNVSKVYDTGTEAVHNANFTINKGDFAFLVGSSGSGKSTLIKLIVKEEEQRYEQYIQSEGNREKMAEDMG